MNLRARSMVVYTYLYTLLNALARRLVRPHGLFFYVATRTGIPGILYSNLASKGLITIVYFKYSISTVRDLQMSGGCHVQDLDTQLSPPHFPFTDPPRRITGRLLWLVHCPEHPGSNERQVLAYPLTSLIFSDRIRSRLDLPGLS